MKSFILGISTFLIFSSCFIEKPAANTKFVKLPVKTKISEEFRGEFLSRINRLRTQGCNCGNKYQKPAPPLIWNTELELAALGHAQDMSRNRYFDHKSKNGQALIDRLFATGYTYDGFQSYFIGENIAMGQNSIREVMDGWIASEKHCKNLMNPDFKEVGIAVVNSYWVQDFGARNPFNNHRTARR